MLAFAFATNKSFRTTSSRPITIPRSQVDYRRLEAMMSTRDVIVVLPDGREVAGMVYRGKSGFGQYYQVRMRGSNVRQLGALPLGKKLWVVLAKSSRGLTATLLGTCPNFFSDAA